MRGTVDRCGVPRGGRCRTHRCREAEPRGSGSPARPRRYCRSSMPAKPLPRTMSSRPPCTPRRAPTRAEGSSVMRFTSLVVLSAVAALPTGLAAQRAADAMITLQANEVLDGTGRVLQHARIVVRDGRIVSVDEGTRAAPTGPVYDLRGLT